MNRTKQSVQRELQQHYQNLDKIREKIALYTEMEAPIPLLNQLEQLEAEIEELEELLKTGQLSDESDLTDVRSNDDSRAVQDDEVHGDKVAGDKVGRDKFTVSGVSGTGIAIGSGHVITVKQGADSDKIAKSFAQLYQALDKMPDTMQKSMTQQAVKTLEEEARKGEQADEKKVKEGFEVILAMLPDIGEVALNTFINPIQGLSTVFQKIAQKAREKQ